MSKKRILCVEDSEDICILITAIFSDHEVLNVHNAFDALQLIENEKFDLYLFDYDLPDKSGIELTNIIKTFDRKTPILFMTGLGTMTEKKATDAGAQGLIIKGTSNFIDDLESSVSLALS